MPSHCANCAIVHVLKKGKQMCVFLWFLVGVVEVGEWCNLASKWGG